MPEIHSPAQSKPTGIVRAPSQTNGSVLLSDGPAKISDVRPTLNLRPRHSAASVYFADLDPWDCFVQFAAALRMRGVRVHRISLADRWRSRRMADALQNIVYHSTLAVLPADANKWAASAAEWLPSGEFPIEAIDDIAAALRGLPRVRMRTSSASYERLLSDKLSMTAFCAGLGLPVPQTFAAESEHNLTYPFVVKPRLGCGGCGVSRIADQFDREAVAAMSQANPGTLLAQQELQGQLLHVGGVAKEGKTLQAAVYGDPDHNSSDFRPVLNTVILDEPDVLGAADKLIAALGLTGAFCFDYIRIADGSPMLLDVNARVFGSWLPLQQAGLDVVGSYMFAWGFSESEPRGEIVPGSRLSVPRPFTQSKAPNGEMAQAMRTALRARGTLGLRWTIAALLYLISARALHAWNGVTELANRHRRCTPGDGPALAWQTRRSN